MSQGRFKTGFGPIIDTNSKVLILGSLPGNRSLELTQYYAYPTNHFWKIITEIFNVTCLADYEARIAFIKNKRIALWDVLYRAQRNGSLDTAIRNEVPNDFSSLFDVYKEIRAVGLNGRKAEHSFKNHVIPELKQFDRTIVGLPSTSAANTMRFDNKLQFWRAFFTTHLNDQ